MVDRINVRNVSDFFLGKILFLVYFSFFFLHFAFG